MKSNLALDEKFYQNPLFWVYIVGILIMTAGGTYFQWKCVKMDPHDLDDFRNFDQAHDSNQVVMGEQSLVELPELPGDAPADEEAARQKK